MTNANRPATVAEVLAIADTTAQGVGFLITQALAQVSPDGATRFYSMLSGLPQTDSDLDAFIEQAIVGSENALAVIESDTDD